MKASFKDYATILLAFIVVLSCGVMIGRMTAPAEENPASMPVRWEEESLSILMDSLDLSPGEIAIAEREINRTASEIRQAREQTILTYHRRLAELYARLIERLDAPNAARLRAEKRSLDQKIEALAPET